MTTSRILVVEDNPKNLKLVRDVLQLLRLRGHRGDVGRGRRPARRRGVPGPDPDGPPAARHRRGGGAAPDPGRARRNGTSRSSRSRRSRCTRTGDGPSTRGSTATSRSRSACAACRSRCRDFLELGGSAMTELPTRPTRVLVVDDQPPNVRLLEAILTPRGYDVRTAASGEEALGDDRGDATRPGAARHRDARDGRLRGLPADPRADRHGVPAGRDGHRERRRAEGQGARGRRRRLRDQAGRPERAARPGGVAGPDQALPGHDQATGRRAGRLEQRARAPGRDPGGPAASGWAGCAGSSPRSWPS